MERLDLDLDYMPEWFHPDYKQAVKQVTNITKAMVKLYRAISLLEDHETKGTVPKSLNVNIKAQVEKSCQAQVDQEVGQAAKIFQTSVLASIIKARRKEMVDKKKALEEIQKNLQKKFIEIITDLRNNTIISLTDDEIRTKYKRVCDMFHQRMDLIEKDLRLDEYFEFKKKQVSIAASKAAREEARINQELEDPKVKKLQDRITALEKQLVSISRTSKPASLKKQPINKAQQAPKKAPKGPKGKGPLPKRGGGPKNGPGKGDQKPQLSSTPLINRSVSNKQGFRKKQN